MGSENIITVAGTQLHVCTTLPAANTETAFEALTTWKKVGEITDVPSVLGREYATSSHAPVDSAQEVEKKGNYKLGSSEFKMGWDDDDEGQQICYAASLNYDILAFRVTKQDQAVRYFTAQVSKFTEDMGTVNNVVQGSMTLLRQTDTVRVPAP